jgi:hypothetical protein
MALQLEGSLKKSEDGKVNWRKLVRLILYTKKTKIYQLFPRREFGAKEKFFFPNWLLLICRNAFIFLFYCLGYFWEQE